MRVGILSLFCAIGPIGWLGSSQVISAPRSPTPSMQDVPRDVWHLTLQLTGGFTGVDRQLELASTGVLNVTDRRRATQVSTEASASELAQIASMVAGLKSIDPDRDSTCRDCLQYELRIRLSERSLLFKMNDVSLVGTPLEPLAKALTSVLNRELSNQPNTQRK